MDACFEILEEYLKSQKNIVSVFGSKYNTCKIYVYPKSKFFQLFVAGQADGFLVSPVGYEFTTIYKPLDPAVVIFWILDNVS